MRRFCFLIVILTLGLASQSAVDAGQRGFKHRGHRGGGGGDRIRVALELTDDQQQELAAMREEFKQAAQEIRVQVRDGSLTREEARPQLEVQREARREALAEVLTTEQLEQLEQLKAANAERRGSRGHHHGGLRGRAMRRVFQALGLSEDQRLALQTLRDEARQAHREIRAQVKEGSLTREEARPLLQAQREARRGALVQILTPEQLGQLEDLRNAHRHRGVGENDAEGGSADAVPLQLAPDTVSLLQNAPNPFNPETEIRFDVSREAFVNVSVYNTVGQKIATLVDNYVGPGNHAVQWRAEDNPSGIYFYRMETNGSVQTRRMLLLK